ncbi:MAG: class I SAM-dependent methyltransferase, partial [Nitrososphaera sp.]|nr:class I SAM-dependent methyltransferase [Nitrososphaera sp.]
PPAVIADVGGGPGVYSCWLARRGYQVHLVDTVPLHVEQARQASQSQPEHPIASLTVGDARQLNHPDGSVDGVLMFGPLYHLTDRKDRITALREAYRVLQKNGLLFAAGISRFASTLDGLMQKLFDDPEFVHIVQCDLVDGQHRNLTNNPIYFTTAFFHRPEELKVEVEEAGFRHEKTLPIEGPAWLLQNFEDHWRDPKRRERLLDAVRWIENEPSLLGVSAHLMAIAHKDS